MDYVCFQQRDITASNISSGCCLLHVHIFHPFSYSFLMDPFRVRLQQVFILRQCRMWLPEPVVPTPNMYKCVLSVYLLSLPNHLCS